MVDGFIPKFIMARIPRLKEMMFSVLSVCLSIPGGGGCAMWAGEGGPLC